MRTLASFALALLAAGAAPAAAQSIAAGTRVRVSAPNLVAPVIGSVQTVRGDTLVVLEDGTGAQVWSIPRETVTRFEVSRGLFSRDRREMTRGAVWGAAGGALVFIVAAEALDASAGPRTNYKTLPSALLGATVGAGLGALWGSRRSVEVWSAAPVPRSVAFIPHLPTRTDGLGATLAFRIGF